MTARGIGRILLAVGAVLLGLAIVALVLGGGIGQFTPGGVLLASAIFVIGLGGLIVSAVGARWLPGALTRVSAAILSIGLVAMAGFSVINMQMTTDPLERTPAIILGGIGLFAIPVGTLLTLGSLLWHLVRRRPRSAS